MSDYNCRSCRDWTGCVGKAFFSYAEIQFCVHQVYWLIQNRLTLREGVWPAEPDDNSGSGNTTSEASFAKVILIIAEMDERLNQLSGAIRKDLINLIDRGIEIRNFNQTSGQALYYISGWDRRYMPFYQWKWQRKRRKHDDKTSSKLVKTTELK